MSQEAVVVVVLLKKLEVQCGCCHMIFGEAHNEGTRLTICNSAAEAGIVVDERCSHKPRSLWRCSPTEVVDNAMTFLLKWRPHTHQDGNGHNLFPSS